MNPALKALAPLFLIPLLACDRETPPSVQAAITPKENAVSNVIHITTPAFDNVNAQTKPARIDFWAPSIDRRLR